mmetsp:Transcript_64354/g.149725  ORF Transcript_64354/g.149725 Transcript_64354/m.149725 type:complete len:196 (+) Transcript_64354:31-618(+)
MQGTAARAPVPASANKLHLPAGIRMLAVRNLPWSYTFEQLLELWPLDGSYDYIHLPWKLSKRRNVGYVFINFVSTQCATEFAERWHGFTPPNRGFRKALNVAVASIQSVRESLGCLQWEDLVRLVAVGAAPLVIVNNRRVDARLAYVAFGLREAEGGPSEVAVGDALRPFPLAHEAPDESTVPWPIQLAPSPSLW